MKKALTLLASALFLLCAVPAVQAGVSISGMYGIMDTELLDEGEYYGGQLELGAGPISLIARGGYARDFDALNPDHWKFQNGDAVSSILDRFGVRTSDLNLDDFGIVPIEIGAIYRLNIVSGILNIYGGGGVGYYYIPAFDILGNLSNVRRTLNAQGRTETWYNVIPRYVMAHVVYRLNIQPRKRGAD